MAKLTIRAFDAERRKLDDWIDVDVRDLTSGQLVGTKRNVKGTASVTVPVQPGRPHSVQVFPLRHRPVGVIEISPDGNASKNVHVFCPVHPQRVVDVGFPDYDDLAPELRAVLEVSALEPDLRAPASGAATGRTLYDGLDTIPRAGLLNLFVKMQNTLSGGRTMWSFVDTLYRVRGDRIFADVAIDFRDHVKSGEAGGEFARVNDALHTPPPDFTSAGSFKHQLFHAGVLQLTFFSSVASPLRFKLDADIDDAGGLGHVFQVLRNWITQGETNPYDIHQILVFSQFLNPSYRLLTGA
jgi:hypothetical protein